MIGALVASLGLRIIPPGGLPIDCKLTHDILKYLRPYISS